MAVELDVKSFPIYRIYIIYLKNNWRAITMDDQEFLKKMLKSKKTLKTVRF